MPRKPKRPDNSLPKMLTHIGVGAALLASSIISMPSAILAYEGSIRMPAKHDSLFGVTRSDMLARQDTDDLLDSPVEEDNVPGMKSLSPRSTLRLDIHGETSVENFQGTQSNLAYTHESAGGFRQFLEKWYPANFHYMDGNVSSWLFHDAAGSNQNFDLYTSQGIDYGIDAVRVLFHSSHGITTNNVFRTSLGANWNNTGWDATSTLMALGGNYNRFGNERLRYIFWDTCFSVMISGGNNPSTTWGAHAKGIRFVFGYATTSLDSANYGKFFWEEWSKGKTFKTAFFDASKRVSTNQTPALIAFGATSSEASSRRDTERMLAAEPVSNAWGAWAWASARSLRASLPKALATMSPVDQVEVASRSNSDEEVTEIATAFGIDVPDARTIMSRPANIKVVRTKAMTLAVEESGHFELFRNIPEEAAATTEEEADTEAKMSDTLLVRRAQRRAALWSFLPGQALRVGMIRAVHENTGTSNYQGQARITEKTVILDQTINGTPFIDPEAGHLEITFNARSGQVTRVRNTLKVLQPVSTRARAGVQMLTLEEARQAALGTFQQATGSHLKSTAPAEILTDSEDVGYQMIDGKAVLVYRAHVKSAVQPGMRPFQAIIPLVK